MQQVENKLHYIQSRIDTLREKIQLNINQFKALVKERLEISGDYSKENLEKIDQIETSIDSLQLDILTQYNSLESLSQTKIDLIRML